jgi:hypothetical protein
MLRRISLGPGADVLDDAAGEKGEGYDFAAAAREAADFETSSSEAVA